MHAQGRYEKLLHQLILDSNAPLRAKMFDNGSPTAPYADLPRFSWWNRLWCPTGQRHALTVLRLPFVFIIRLHLQLWHTSRCFAAC